MYILYVYIHSYTRNTPESCGSLLGALCIALAYAIYTIVSLAYFSTISIRSVRVTNGDDRHDQSQCLGKFEVTCSCRIFEKKIFKIFVYVISFYSIFLRKTFPIYATLSLRG